ncbi:MAG TPA: hypothetical protein VNJ71_06545 [Gemmatimonadales bacterium]|nr:hypothetical protein [Gemmatimonadales bacterium]
MRAPTILPALGAILGTSLSLTRAAPAQTPAEQALVNAAADTATVVHPGPTTGGIDPAFASLGRTTCRSSGIRSSR